MLGRGAIVDTAGRASTKELQMYEGYETAPDGTYVETCLLYTSDAADD